MPRVKAKVTPALLTWAREDAGFSIPTAAKQLKVKPEKLLAWERGEDSPSLPVARRIAELYRRPLALFYLKEPPLGFMVMHDFRRLPGEVAGIVSPALRFEVRRAQERRQTAIELAADLEDVLKPFEHRCRLTDDPEALGGRLRSILQVTDAGQSRWRSPDVAWRQWRQHAEAAGVLVFLTTTFPTSEARGFSIAEKILPVVGVNRKDAHAGRCFTLLHEVAHLMLRVGGLCDLHEGSPRAAEEDRVEVFCNAVAGAALVPKEVLLEHRTVVAHRRAVAEWTEDELAGIALRFGCSREVVLRRLLKFQRTSKAFYQARRDYYEEEARKIKERAKSSKQEVRRNIAVETVSALGRPFLRLALAQYHERRITLNDLSDLLGVKARHVAKIDQRVTTAA